IAGLETDGRSGRDVESHSICGLAVKIEITIHFKKMAVRPDLNGTIAKIFHFNSNRAAAGIRFDRFGPQDELSRNHDVLFRAISTNRLMDSDQFSAVRKSPFHLDFVDHLGYALHYIF